MKRQCLVCGEGFKTQPNVIKHGHGKYCSRECSNHSKIKAKVTRICPTCGKEYKARPSRIKIGLAKFCSVQCFRQSLKTSIKQTCQICGEEFLVCPSRKQKGEGKFCSLKCFGKWSSKNLIGGNHPGWRGGKIKRICFVCKKEFTIDPAQIKFGRGKNCSVKCQHISNQTAVIKNCLVCGKEFKAQQNLLKRNGGKYCSHKCGSISKIGKLTTIETRVKMSKSARKGENNNMWKGGITPENKRIRESIEMRLWRATVFARDNYTCQKCGARSKKGERVILHPHHIKAFANFPELRFVVDNGITLHKECHQKEHLGRNHNIWAPA